MDMSKLEGVELGVSPKQVLGKGFMKTKICPFEY